jgi:hypothetical protein
MRVGILLALAVVAEVILLLTTVTDGVSMARVVLVVALATQAAAIGTFMLTRGRR